MLALFSLLLVVTVSLFVSVFVLRIGGLRYSYPLLLVSLLFISTLSAVTLLFALTGQTAGIPRVLGVLFSAASFLYFGTLAVGKLRMRDGWRRSPTRLFRTETTVDLPRDHFCLKTENGVKLRGYHVHRLPEGHLTRNAVVVVHGGFRSKDILAKGLLISWLSRDFDIFAFDVRGHGKSSGAWTGDAQPVEDLRQVISFVRSKGYQKIGVFGRSMGGWCAVLEAARYGNVDALAVAGIPAHAIKEIPEFAHIAFLLGNPLVTFAVEVWTGTRLRDFHEDGTTPLSAISNIHDTPVLLLYNQVDPNAGVIADTEFCERYVATHRLTGRLRHLPSFTHAASDLYDAANEPKELYLLPGVGHVYTLDGLPDFFDKLRAWFREHLESDPVTRA